MTIISSYIFWVIVAAIIIVLAAIGYLAEGTEFANKALNKKKNDAVQTDTGLVKADLPVEVLKVQDAPSAWTGDVPIASERQERVHTETSIDDWINVPNNISAPKIEKKDIQKAMKNDNNPDINVSDASKNESNDIEADGQGIFDESQEMFPDIKPEDLEPLESVNPVNQDAGEDTVWK